MIYPREHVVPRFPAGEEPWSSIEPISLDSYMGDPPGHRPRVLARLAWDEASLKVRFDVDDRYVLAATEHHQGSVCQDSCVELFFTPGPDVSEGYFNIECNCGGTALFHHQRSRANDGAAMDARAIEALEVSHSLPARIVPEIDAPTDWTVSYRVPFEILERYAPVLRPRSGAIWRANVYKCADLSSHPHWLTWSFVDRPRPDFHRKEYFGILRFL